MRHVLMVAGALGAMFGTAGVAAQHSASEVSAARAECVSWRERYEELEATYVPPPEASSTRTHILPLASMGDNDLTHARKMWERYCAYADALEGSRGVSTLSTQEQTAPGFQFERAPAPPPIQQQAPPRPAAPAPPNVGGTRPPTPPGQ